MFDSAIKNHIPYGLYPQREELQANWLEKRASAFFEKFHRSLKGRNGRLKALSRRIQRLDAVFNPMSEFELKQEALKIREALRRQGATSANVVRAFALVREVSQRKLGMKHYPVQLLGGLAMMNGMIMEMQTGEGKTLTATLPACTAALAGIPVHIITVNDYLVQRDAALMAPVYSFFGLQVGAVGDGMQEEERRAAYNADITYCTNKQVAFDYLRDRILISRRAGKLRLQLEGLFEEQPRSEQLIMRGLYYAIVDEADSVLIDEAVTPLIISRKSDNSHRFQYYKIAMEMAAVLQQDTDFRILLKERAIDLTETGKENLDRLGKNLGGIWRGPCPREELVTQALKALHILVKDQHYLVDEDKVKIVDEFTGRILADRSWEQGLHQLVELKENCEMSGEMETLGRISYQRFFRRYIRLAGMSGTVHEVHRELWSVYRLQVKRIPPAVKSRRRARADVVFNSDEDKWKYIVNRIGELHKQRQPVLVGTRSVKASEHLSQLLKESDFPHQLLNARQDKAESDIIAQAGQPGRITVATNMAGRGTDILLGEGVSENGGLHVIATEKHESRRIDRQLFGRCGRQGDRGGHEAILSRQDEVIQNYCPAAIRVLIFGGGRSASWFSRRVDGLAWSAAQRVIERKQYVMRKSLLKMDERMGDVLAFSGVQE